MLIFIIKNKKCKKIKKMSFYVLTFLKIFNILKMLNRIEAKIMIY